MLKKTFVVKLPSGLHARPATLFVQKASSFPCEIFIIKGDKRVNGKSIMGIMSLGVAAGQELTIEADGENEAEAVVALGEILESVHE